MILGSKSCKWAKKNPEKSGIQAEIRIFATYAMAWLSMKGSVSCICDLPFFTNVFDKR